MADTALGWATCDDDALVQVLQLLPLDVCARAACVCRAWRAAAADPRLWRTLRFDGDCAPATALSNNALAQLCARAGSALRELRVDAPACAAVTAEGVLAAVRSGHCTGVERLALRALDTTHWGAQLRATDALTDVQAAQLASACPALRHASCCVRVEGFSRAYARLPGPLTLISGKCYLFDWDEEDELLPPCVGALVVPERGFLDGATARLAHELRTNVTLRTILFVEVYITHEDAVILLEGLKTNASLTALHLRCSEFGAATAVAFGTALRTNSTLTTLDLSSNHDFGNDGAAALADGLHTNTSLLTLNLSFCRIKDGGATALAEALRMNATLTELSLHDNDIADAGAAAFAGALRTNTALKSLSLRENRIHWAATNALREAVRLNTTLKDLDLCYQWPQ